MIETIINYYIKVDKKPTYQQVADFVGIEVEIIKDLCKKIKKSLKIYKKLEHYTIVLNQEVVEITNLMVLKIFIIGIKKLPRSVVTVVYLLKFYKKYGKMDGEQKEEEVKHLKLKELTQQ